MRRLLQLAIGPLICTLPALSDDGTLKVGDDAPPLTITDWVKGKPFDLAKDGKDKVVVLEFWATWCFPCIEIIPETNELYRKYKDKGLHLVAITDSGQGQQLKAVQEFVNQQGKRMDYPVAFDSTQKTYTTYVMGTGAYGIPHSVVIGKSGKIIWFGHPGQPQMEQIIRDLLLDRYDPQKAAAAAALQERLEPLLNDFNMAARGGDWDKCLSSTQAMLEIDPANFDALRFTVVIYLEERRSLDDMRKWVNGYLDARTDNAQALATLAGLMLAMPDMADRQPDLAVKAAGMAYKAGPQDAEILQAVAEVYFQIGDVETAIAFQTKAVEAANRLEVDSAREVLSFLEACKSLKGTS